MLLFFFTALIIMAQVVSMDMAQAVAVSTIGTTDKYAYSPKQTYTYKVVLQHGGTLRNIHVGLPQFATFASDSTISSPSFGSPGRAVKYSTYYDYYPPSPAFVGAGWTIYFTVTGAINPSPSTVSALIEAWNTAGVKYNSFRSAAYAFPFAPLPTYPAVRNYPVPNNLCTPNAYTTASENTLPGSTGWQLTNPANSAAPEIEAYADRSSAHCGQTFGMHVNVTDASSTFTTEVWRYGWYGGSKGRLVATLGPTTATKQANRVLKVVERSNNAVTPSLQSPRTATTANNWTTSLTVTIPPDWTPGTYLFKLTNSNGRQTYVPLWCVMITQRLPTRWP